MIDIEHHALRALEQNAAAEAHGLVEPLPRGLRVSQNLRRDGEQVFLELDAIRLRQAEAETQRAMVRQQAIELEIQRGGIGEVSNSDGAAAGLVFVGRADAAACGADLGGCGLFLARGVDVLVPGQNENSVVGEDQVVRPEADARLADALDLVEQVPRVDHHAVADDRELAAAHDAGGQEVQLEHLAVDDQRVAGIVAALEAHDHVGPAGQPVDDLALALVAPLGADNHHAGHGILR